MKFKNIDTNISVTLIKDSCYDADDGTSPRISTFVMDIPKFLLAELNTHRVNSRNSQSSRAVTPGKYSAMVPMFDPIVYGLECSGMRSKEEAKGDQLEAIKTLWNEARENAIAYSRSLSKAGLHKQWASRVAESFYMARSIVTATTFENFFDQRCSEYAQPEFEYIATMMREQLRASTPGVLTPGEYHIPYEEELPDNIVDLDKRLDLCAAMIAKVSYRNEQFDEEGLTKVVNMLKGMRHASPFEHIAKVPEYTDYEAGAVDTIDRPVNIEDCLNPTRWHSGNLKGWIQYRRMLGL